MDDLKERRGYSHLKEEALDCTMWRAHFGGGFGPVINERIYTYINSTINDNDKSSDFIVTVDTISIEFS